MSWEDSMIYAVVIHKSVADYIRPLVKKYVDGVKHCSKRPVEDLDAETRVLWYAEYERYRAAAEEIETMLRANVIDLVYLACGSPHKDALYYKLDEYGYKPVSIKQLFKVHGGDLYQGVDALRAHPDDYVVFVGCHNDCKEEFLHSYGRSLNDDGDMVAHITGYGLRSRSSGDLVGRSATCGPCGDIEHGLDTGEENVWFTCSALEAACSANDDYEVVKIIITAEPETVKIPTENEYLKMKYNDPDSPSYDPHHYEFVMKQRVEQAKLDADRVWPRPDTWPRHLDLAVFFGDGKNAKVMRKYGFTEWKKYGYDKEPV
jgi:hypothetical protein